jgi:ribonuclease HI
MDDVVAYVAGVSIQSGACGWACAIVRGAEVEALSGAGFKLSTRNRAEIAAATVALETIPAPARIEVVSRCDYVVNTVNKFWNRNANSDLWDDFYAVRAVHISQGGNVVLRLEDPPGKILSGCISSAFASAESASAVDTAYEDAVAFDGGTKSVLPHISVSVAAVCLENGNGGWAAAYIGGKSRREVSGGYTKTNRGRIEIYSLIESLNTLTRPCRVDFVFPYARFAEAVAGHNRSHANLDLWGVVDIILGVHDVKFRFVSAADPALLALANTAAENAVESDTV